MDSRRHQVGEIVAREVAADHTTATVDAKAPIRAEFLIARVERAAEALEPTT
jgi:hypothetical protein